MREMTVNEAATVLGISARAVRMRIEGRKLAAVKIGGQYTVLMDDEPEPPGRESAIFAVEEARKGLEAALPLVERLARENGTLAAELGAMTEERDALIALLAEEREETPPPPVGFWAWLRGGLRVRHGIEVA